MKFDSPATTNPVDQLKVIGKATDRIDGPLKVTGTATYAYEQHAAAPNAAYGDIVGAAIAEGRITSIDLSKANTGPGVIAIVTADNAGPLSTGEFYIDLPLAGPQSELHPQRSALVGSRTCD